MIEYLLSLSLLICVVLLIRGIFRKNVSPRAIYALWLVVVVRMFLPITLFEVDVALPAFLQKQQTEQLLNDSETTADDSLWSQANSPVQTTPTTPTHNTIPVTPTYPSVTTPVTPFVPNDPVETSPLAPITPGTEAQPSVIPEETPSELTEEPVPADWKRIANTIWLIGTVISAVWVMFTSITYSRRLLKDRRLYRTVRGTKVYVSESAGVPCIAGLIPSIYITPEAANSKSEMLIIIHEHIHLRHGDHIWTIVRALALIVFWWNPLVWVAATVSKQDAELACDDAISAKLNEDGRLKYANILLDTIPQKHRYAVGLGSAPMKERILRLTKKQKNRWICLVLAIVLAVSAVGCSFIGTRKITLENIFEQKGFTILSQEEKDIELSFPSDKLPTYQEVATAETAELMVTQRNITAFQKGASTIRIEKIGVYGRRPAGLNKDVLYICFTVQHELTDANTLLSISRVENTGEEVTSSWIFAISDGIVYDENGAYEDSVDMIGCGPDDKFFAVMDASFYAQLSGEIKFSVHLNEIVYERGSEVKMYGPVTAENDTSELDSEDQKTETYSSMDEYIAERMAQKTTVNYYSVSKYNAAPEGHFDDWSATANVTDTKVIHQEKKGEVDGLAEEGVLECWEYWFYVKLDVPADDVMTVDGDFDGWFDMDGNHTTIALRQTDGTYTILWDNALPSGIDFISYRNSYEEAIYDWYVTEYGLDLPLYVQDWADKITTPNGEYIGNQPVHRFDGDGWGIYIPIAAWYQSTDVGENQWLWCSSYLTGSTLLVEKVSHTLESEAQESTFTDGKHRDTYYYENPNGGFWRVTTEWTDECVSSDNPNVVIEPQLLKLMAESFIILDKPNTFVSTEDLFQSIIENKASFTLASSKENMLLTEYKATTDYSVKKYTILDLNDDRDPEMVLWLGYGTNDYAGFLVLHRDGDIVYAHGFPYRGFNGLNGDGVYTSSSSAFNMSILKLDFDGDTCTETVLARRQGDGSSESVTYYIEDRIATAEEFENYLNRYNSRSLPDWYSYDIEEIKDIDDWHTLLWADGLSGDEDKQPSQNVYTFIRELVKGESDISELNGLGIEDYSIALLKDSAFDSLFRFTFTVTGNTLLETLPPGTYTWTLLDGMELGIYTEDVPTNQEEGTAYENRMHGLDQFGDNPAARAVDTYLSWMPYIYEVSPYGAWDMTDPHLPYNYICAYYGKNLEISFSELQNLMSEKFGIAVERPEKSDLLNRWLNRCAYDEARDIVYYADTRGYEPVHRIIGVREVDGVSEVTVQLFADRLYLIPSHKVVYRIGEGEVFLGCEIIQEGNYEPRELS